MARPLRIEIAEALGYTSHGGGVTAVRCIENEPSVAAWNGWERNSLIAKCALTPSLV